MKVHTVGAIKPNADVYNNEPMRKADLPTESRDDRMAGSMLAHEAVALAMGDSVKWRTLAVRVINLTVEARKVFIETLKDSGKMMRDAHKSAGFEKKFTAAQINSFNVQLSKLRQVANAWNKGGDLHGMAVFLNSKQEDEAKHVSETDILANAGFEAFVTYARTFSEGKPGRPPQSWMTKAQKWLETNKPDEDATPTEVGAYTAMLEQFTTFFKAANIK